MPSIEAGMAIIIELWPDAGRKKVIAMKFLGAREMDRGGGLRLCQLLGRVEGRLRRFGIQGRGMAEQSVSAVPVPMTCGGWAATNSSRHPAKG
jgi:hypothetical protein